jgi:hypothetical protein
MSDRGGARGVILALAVASGACGGVEQQVVRQYFDATNAKDTQGISSFALVGFDKKVDTWTITQDNPETRTPAILPDLAKRLKEAEAAQSDNTKAARAYNLEHFKEVDQVRDIEKKAGKIPPALAATAAEWDKFNKQDRELKKAVVAAKEAADKERRIVTLSVVGQAEDLDSLSGEVVTKPMELSLTIQGQPQPYVMTLRKYDVQKGDKGPKLMSRWVVLSVEPKK